MRFFRSLHAFLEILVCLGIPRTSKPTLGSCRIRRGFRRNPITSDSFRRNPHRKLSESFLQDSDRKLSDVGSDDFRQSDPTVGRRRKVPDPTVGRCRKVPDSTGILLQRQILIEVQQILFIPIKTVNVRYETLPNPRNSLSQL